MHAEVLAVVAWKIETLMDVKSWTINFHASSKYRVDVTYLVEIQFPNFK